MADLYETGGLAPNPRQGLVRISQSNLFCSFILLLLFNDQYSIAFIPLKHPWICNWLRVAHRHRRRPQADAQSRKPCIFDSQSHVSYVP